MAWSTNWPTRGWPINVRILMLTFSNFSVLGSLNPLAVGTENLISSRSIGQNMTHVGKIECPKLLAIIWPVALNMIYLESPFIRESAASTLRSIFLKDFFSNVHAILQKTLTDKGSIFISIFPTSPLSRFFVLIKVFIWALCIILPLACPSTFYASFQAASLNINILGDEWMAAFPNWHVVGSFAKYSS